MVSRCNNTYLGILGSNHNTCSSLPIRAVKAISGDPTRSIGKVGPHCSYRPFFRSSFVSQPRFNVFISHSRRIRADIKDGNGGGGGGGGNGGGGPGWKDPYIDDDDDNSRDGQVPSFLIILIKSLAISALVTPLYILLTKWLREILSRDSGDDIQTVRRLLRETFEELVKVREKLSLVEKVSGIQEEAVDYGAGTSVRLHATGPQILAAKQGTRHVSSSLSGSLTLGGGLLWEDEVDSTDTTAKDASLLEISKLGVKLGTDMILRFSGMVRGGLDSVLAEVQVDPGEDHFALQKITYHCNPLPWIKAIFSPFGASAQDVAYTLNPLAGQGLTSLVRQGSLLHHTILGRTLGATVGLQRAWLSAAWFSPQGLPPLSMPNETDHAFLQAIVAPTKHLSLGLAMIEPLQMPSTVNQALNEEIVEESVPMQAAEKVRRFAALVALRSFGLVMHGWATSEGDLAMHRSWNGKQWGFSVGPKAVQGAGGEGASWAVAVGRLGETRGIQHWQKAIQPDTYEVSAQIHVGEGMSVIPGITTLRKNDRTTVFAGLKTSWQF